MVTLPRMVTVRARRRGPELRQPGRATARALRNLPLSPHLRPGQRVAVTAGSRGIARVAEITRGLVDFLRDREAEPFIIPAMGSHGGATAEGQRAILAEYGITEATMRVPIRSTMEVIEIGRTPEGIPVYLDRHAAEADHIVVVNRIKPHTAFTDRFGSGLMKMMALGLGKHPGAIACHEATMAYGFARVITAVSQVVLAKTPILFGLAILENSQGGLAAVAAIPAEILMAEELKLYRKAARWAPRLPFEELDLLIVEEMGKNVAGTGMDTNVIGRRCSLIEPPPKYPRIDRIFVRGLSPETRGNANGIGLADFTTDRVCAMVDRHATYMNAVTARTPDHARLPVSYPTDREVLDVGLRTIRTRNPMQARILRIQNTLELSRFQVSEALLPEVRARRDLVTEGEPVSLEFDAEGFLRPFHA